MEFNLDKTKDDMISEMKKALNNSEDVSKFDIEIASNSSVVVSFQNEARGYQREHLIMPEFKMSEFDEYEEDMRNKAQGLPTKSDEIFDLYYHFGRNVWLQAATLYLKTEYDHVLDIMINVSDFDEFDYEQRFNCSVKEIANEYLVGVLKSNELDENAPLNTLLSYENNNDTKRIKIGFNFDTANSKYITSGIKDLSLTIEYFDKNNIKRSCSYQSETIIVQPEEIFDPEIFTETMNEQAQIFLNSPEFKNIKALVTNNKPTP